MSILGFLNKATSTLQPILGIGSLLVILMIAWGYLSNEDYADSDDTVTITFRCTPVLSSANNYPDIVVSECTKLRNEK